MTAVVSAVIPTVGRQTLFRAVRSALEQTRPVAEVLVVADTDRPIELPDDDRIILLRTAFRSGPARCRQLAIESARGSVIALLDDDDEWYSSKLERQLAAAPSVDSDDWILSCRTLALGPGSRNRTWPRRLIGPGQSVSDYLFRVTEVGAGGALLQTSTLVFPVGLARKVPWDSHAGAVHDEPSWLMEVQKTVPGLRLIQLPDVLGIYGLADVSLSRSGQDRTAEYIRWGLQYLQGEPPRILGDYMCSSPVSAAVSAQSLGGVMRALGCALRYGRPGPYAITYAALNAVRIAIRRVGASVRR